MNNIYVADSGNNRIQKFDSNGNYITQWNITTHGITFYDNQLYVSGNAVIRQFTTDASLLVQWGSAGSSNGQFVNPAGISIDNGGSIYVIDSGNNRVQKFKDCAKITLTPTPTTTPVITCFTSNTSDFITSIGYTNYAVNVTSGPGVWTTCSNWISTNPSGTSILPLPHNYLFTRTFNVPAGIYSANIRITGDDDMHGLEINGIPISTNPSFYGTCENYTTNVTSNGQVSLKVEVTDAVVGGWSGLTYIICFYPTVIFTPSPTISETETPGNTITVTPTIKETCTNSATMSETPDSSTTITVSNTPTATITATQTITATVTETVTSTNTETNTVSITPGSSGTFTQTLTPTNTLTITKTVTPTTTASVYVVQSNTITKTPSITMTRTESITRTITQTVTQTCTRTFTITKTQTVTSSVSKTHTISPTYTNTLTNTLTKTKTLTPTVTMTATMISSKTITPTLTPYPEGEILIYPNPFSLSKAVNKQLKFKNIAKDSLVSIYTISGELVIFFNAINFEWLWDGKNREGDIISPGIYYYLITTPDRKLQNGKFFVVH